MNHFLLVVRYLIVICHVFILIFSDLKKAFDGIFEYYDGQINQKNEMIGNWNDLNLDDEDYINVDEEVIKPVPQYDPQYARRVSKLFE